jgi:hypothetical protein
MAQEPAAVMFSRMSAAQQPQPQESPMLRNIRLQQEYRAANNQALGMLEAELQAAGMDKKAINDALRIERQAFNQAQKDYQNMFRTQEGTQRYSGFGDGNYYAPTYQYAGPEAEAVRQRQVQAQQFLQQYKIPQFYNQGRTAIGIKSPSGDGR